MAVSGLLHFSPEMGTCRSQKCGKQFKYCVREKLHLQATKLPSLASLQEPWNLHLANSMKRPMCFFPYRYSALNCRSSLLPIQKISDSCVKGVSEALTRYNSLQGNPSTVKLVSAVGVIAFSIWGLCPLARTSRKKLLHKSDNSWRKSTTRYVLTSYLQPVFLWIGAMLVCRGLDPIFMPSEASNLVKQRLLTFVRSLSTVLAFAYSLSCAIQQAQKFFTEANDQSDTRNKGFQFAGKAVYSAVWVAALSLFMELLGFSTQKLLTAGGLGTVLITLAGREIFTNFLSSVMIHATRPFVVNEWIQTKIEGYEVSGTVEHVGWWSPTIIRGEDREAVHIPNHKFTVNVVRNLTQKTHWRIKTHLAISHLDVNKINNIVADMRKVLAKNPQVEQQRLHRRVFLENINPENQALLVLVSCFVRTSHYEEYSCVKEAILLDLLRVISHHQARLATPIRTIQKIHRDTDLENIPFSETVFSCGEAATNRPFLLVEPSYKINGEERAKSSSRSVRSSGRDQDSQTSGQQPSSDHKPDAVIKGASTSVSKAKETSKSDGKAATTDFGKGGEKTSTYTPKVDEKLTVKSSFASRTVSEKENEVADSETEIPRVPTNCKQEPGWQESQNGKVETPVCSSQIGNETFSGSLRTISVKENKIADSETKIPSVPTNLKQESCMQGCQQCKVETPVCSSNSSNETLSGSLPSSQSKQGEKLPAALPTKSRPALEENIVLGIALDGSKRTLPIDEDHPDCDPNPSVESEVVAKNKNAGWNGKGIGNGKQGDEET